MSVLWRTHRPPPPRNVHPVRKANKVAWVTSRTGAFIDAHETNFQFRPEAKGKPTSCVRHRPDDLKERGNTYSSLLSSRLESSITMPESPEAFIAAEAAGFTWERRSPRPEDEHVLGHTQNWLNALPKGVRPVQMPTMFPRIINELCSLWPETAALDRYFEEKEFSPRDDRQGFPALIKEELLAIHVYSLRNRGGEQARKAVLLGG